MGNQGIKISIPGKDITSPNLEDYVFWSKFPIMKTYLVGTVNYTFNSDIDSVDIDIVHNLGQRKVVWISIDGPNSEWKTAGYWVYFHTTNGNRVLRWWTVHSLPNKISIHYRESTYRGSFNPTGESWNFKYYIFIEPQE